MPRVTGKLDPAMALAMWNEGWSLQRIAETAGPGTSKMAALRAIKRAVARGPGEQRIVSISEQRKSGEVL